MPSSPRTIGQVLDTIRGEFPDLSVSKLRYLESEGLISPERDQPSGYRRFSQQDVDRLLYVLRAQRDRYLPLKVIREHLEAIDRGEEPPEELPAAAQQATKERAPQAASGQPGKLLTRRQVLSESGLGEAALIELERLRIITTRGASQCYGREAVAIADAAKRLGDYGLDPRSLRSVQQAAVLEAALVEQALAPYRRRSKVPREIVGEVYRVVLQAHAAMLHGQLAG